MIPAYKPSGGILNKDWDFLLKNFENAGWHFRPDIK